MATGDYPIHYGTYIEGAGKDTTATFTNGSSQVVGQFTTWESALQPGDQIYAGGIVSVVKSIEDNEHLTLALPWSGPTMNAAPYVAQRWMQHTDPRKIGLVITEYFATLEKVPADVQANANLAKAFATSAYNVQINGQPAGTYSALHHAEMAKRWAEHTDGQDVAGTGTRSAKHHATQAAASAEAANTSKNAAAQSATNAATSASQAGAAQTAAQTSAGSAAASEQRAADWAEKPDGEDVTTPGTRSSRHWAHQAETSAASATGAAGAAQTALAGSVQARDKAEEWANAGYNVQVEPGLFSAYHWSEVARQFAAGQASNIAFAPVGSIQATNVQDAIAELEAEKGSLPNDSVTNAELANMATGTIKGRASAGAGDPEDLTPAQVLSLLGNMAHGQCRLTKSGANLLLSRHNGKHLIINGAQETIPAGGVTLAPPATNGILYYIYAYMNSGTMALEASTTTHSTDSQTGVEIKAGDASRTLVGIARTGSSAWVDTEKQRFVRSWFNDPGIRGKNQYTTDRSTTSASFIEINSEIRIEFLALPGDLVFLATNGRVLNSTGGLTSTGFRFDATTGTEDINATAGVATASQNPGLSAVFDGLSEGYHYVTVVGAVTTGTGTWGGSGGAIAGTTYSLNLAVMRG